MTVEELMNGFTFTELTEDVLAECEHFSCGIDDLDELTPCATPQNFSLKYLRRSLYWSWAVRQVSVR